MLDIQMQFEDAGGTPTVEASARVSGTVSPSLGGSCFLTAVTLTITDGDLIVPKTNGQDVHFAGTQVAIEHIKFAGECVPELYQLTFNGPAVLMGSVGQPIAVDFNNLVVVVDSSGDFTQVGLHGDVSAACFGGQASLKTQPDLSISPGNPCPNSGTILATLPGGAMAQIEYQGGGVSIDANGDGTFEQLAPTCLDPRLLMCAG